MRTQTPPTTTIENLDSAAYVKALEAHAAGKHAALVEPVAAAIRAYLDATGLEQRLAAFNWVAGLYGDRELTRDDVANELADYLMILDRVPKVYCEVTGGLLSKPNYDSDVVIRAFEDHVQSLIEANRNEHTSAEIGSLAAELMHHEDERVRRLAASALTQVKDSER